VDKKYKLPTNIMHKSLKLNFINVRLMANDIQVHVKVHS